MSDLGELKVNTENISEEKLEQFKKEWKEHASESTNFVQVLDEHGNPPSQPDSVLTTTSKDAAGEIPVPADMSTIVESQEEQHKKFIEDPQNQEKAYHLALNVFDYMGSKPFTFNKALKKMGMDKPTTYQKLKLLEAFGFIVIDKGDPLDSKQRNETVFRLAITMADKIKTMKELIAVKERELDSLKMTLKVWEANQPEPSFRSDVTNPEPS